MKGFTEIISEGAIVVSSLPDFNTYMTQALPAGQDIFPVTGGAEIKFAWLSHLTPRSYGIILNDPGNQIALGYTRFNGIGTQIAGALFEMKKVGLVSATPNTTSPQIMDYLNGLNKYYGFSGNRSSFQINDRLIDQVQASTVGIKLPRS